MKQSSYSHIPNIRPSEVGLESPIKGLVKGSVEYKDCSLTWKKVKERIRQDPEARERFILNLKEALRGSISGT
jgi:hypothetical protein